MRQVSHRGWLRTGGAAAAGSASALLAALLLLAASPSFGAGLAGTADGSAQGPVREAAYAANAASTADVSFTLKPTTVYEKPAPNCVNATGGPCWSITVTASYSYAPCGFPVSLVMDNTYPVGGWQLTGYTNCKVGPTKFTVVEGVTVGTHKICAIPGPTAPDPSIIKCVTIHILRAVSPTPKPSPKPTPTPTPSPSPTPTPSPSPSPSPSPTPSPSPSPIPSPSPSPSPGPTPSPTAPAGDPASSQGLPEPASAVAATFLLAIGGMAGLLSVRRRRR